MRRSFMRVGRRRSRYSRRERDYERMRWCKTLPCCKCGKPGPSEAHHAGRRGLGMKSRDDETIPLCTRCHRDISLLDGWESKAARREWLDEQIAETQSRYLARDGRL